MQIGDDLMVNILDVIRYSRGKGTYKTYKRTFSALSFRLKSETTFIYQYGKIHAKKGDVFLIPKGIEYTSQTEGEDMIVIHFHMANFVSDKIQFHTPLKEEIFKDLFLEIYNIWQEKKPGYKLRATSVFYKILSIAKEDSRDSPDSNPYITAAEYMRSNFQNPNLTIHQVAQSINVCDSLLRREFKKQFNISPKSFLDNLRVEYAVLLLQVNHFSHTEIAERCGFNDVKYFRTVFKKKTGIPISKYKYNF